MQKINKIRFNFVQASDGEISGEDYEEIIVGSWWAGLERGTGKHDKENTVIAIGENEDPDGKSYYNVRFKKNNSLKIYNPNLVFYSA